MQDFSTYFTTEELSFIRSQALLSEKQARFSEKILDFIHRKQWLQVATPNYKEKNPLSAYDIALLFEALAYADGSLGWVINLGAGANMFLGYLEENTSKALEANKKLWLVGSGACTGTAVKTEAGYMVSGEWRYASGSLYASHFTANAFLQDSQGNPVMDAKNKAMFRSFIFPAEQVEVLDTWHTSGLIASCSNDYKVANCFVPHAHVFDLTQQSNSIHSSLYKYPFNAFAIANIAVMCTGMALHFREIFNADIATKKPLYNEVVLGKMPQVQNTFNTLNNAFYTARTDFLIALKNLWQAVDSNQQNQEALERHLKQKAILAVDKAYDLVMGLYRYCGMNTVFRSNELNKVVRDFQVATQHYVISPLFK